MDRLPFKIRTISLEFLGRAVQSSEFLERMLGNGLVLLKWISFAFLLESLIVAPIPAEKVTQWFSGDSGRAIPFSPTIGIPAYLNGYAVIPLVAGMFVKGMVPGTAIAFMVTGGVTSIPAAMGVHAFVRRDVFLQRSHFWTWCRIFGRLRITALGRVFNANLTSCPEHATMYAEVINTYL